MNQVQAGRRDPLREVEVVAMIPMATWKDTECLSVTSPMMWNGKPSKTWWKRKVRFFGRRHLSVCFLGICIQGYFVRPYHFWRPCRSGSSDCLDFFGTSPQTKELLPFCTSAVYLDWTWSRHRGYCNLWGVCQMEVVIKASCLMWKSLGLGSWMA